MKNKLLIIFILLVIAITGGTIYLNKVFLPTKIKSLVVDGLKEKTGKDVTLESLQFNIFQGLVLNNLKIYDDKKTFLSLKEGSCVFLIFPVFKGQLIIPSIRIKSAEIFLHRRQDNSLNIADLFAKHSTGPAAKGKFNVFVRKINVTNSRLKFQDDTVAPTFVKDLDISRLVLYMSLPASVKFELSVTAPVKIKANGEYQILRQELSARANLDGLLPREFAAYYQGLGLKSEGGSVDALLNLSFKDAILSSDITAKAKALSVSAGNISTTLNSAVKANLTYNTRTKNLAYSAAIDIADSPDLVLGGIGRVNAIKGKLNLSNAGVSLDILSAQAKLDKVSSPIEDIAGHIEFNPGQVNWADLNFRYQDIPYKTSGGLSDFKSPVVQLKVSAPDWAADTRFKVENKIITISKLYGHYFDSAFALTGIIDISNPDSLNANLSGGSNLALGDLKLVFKNFAKQLEAAKLDGTVLAKFRLSGNLKDIKSCAIAGLFSGPDIYLYGLRAQDLSLSYNQENGIVQIPLMRASFYDGTVDGSAKVNLNAADSPYWISAAMQGVKIEKLKLDTGAKKANIAGTIQAEAKINGFWNDASKTSGAGKILIKDGKLWELDLFKGFGKLLFAKDFANIVFKEGSADFIVENEYIKSNNILLKSDFVNLTGLCKIGFDGSLDSSINIEVQDEFVPLSGTFKDVATAIIGRAGRFGTIKTTGTLKEPKYKFIPAVMNILDTLKNTIQDAISNSLNR